MAKKLIILFSIVLLLRIIFVFNQDFRFLDQHLGENIIIEGLVKSEVENREKYTRFILDQGENKILIYLNNNLNDKNKEIKYNDFLKIKGKLELPEEYFDENNTRFNYRNFLLKDGIVYNVFYPQVLEVRSGDKSLRYYIYEFKDYFRAKINTLLPTDYAALVGGVLIGDKVGISKEMNEDFKKSGLAHIMVLSGYNMTVVALFLDYILFFINKRFRIFIIISGMIFLLIISGADSPGARALVMASIALLGPLLGRDGDAKRALAVASYILIFINPFILFFDPSFHLSFLATLGIILLSDRIKIKLENKIKIVFLQEAIATTLAAFIFVSPLILYMSRYLSPWGIIANILVVPIVPVLMTSGFTMFLFSTLPFFANILAYPFAFLSYIIISYIFYIVELINSIKWGILSL